MNTLRWLSPSTEGLALEPMESPPEGFRRQWSTLEQAAGVEAGQSVPWTEILAQAEAEDPDVREITLEALTDARLGAPVRPRIRLLASGTLTDADFRLQPQVALSSGEQVRLNRLQGAFYPSHTQGDIILSLDAYRILTTARAPTAPSDSERFLAWGRLKPICVRYGVRLEGYLDDTDVAAVEAIQPEPRWSGDTLTFVPSSSTVDADGLNEALGARRRVQPVLSTVTPGGGRRRIVLSERAQEGTRKVLAQPPLTGSEALTALDNPGRLFDSSVFDLSHFGERVVGIGPPRYRATVTQTGDSGERQWLPDDVLGALYLELSDPAQPEAPPIRIDLSDDEARSAVEVEIRAALEAKQRYARVTEPGTGRQLNVLATHDIHAALLDYRSKKVDDPEDAEDPAGHVLEIHDNIESAEHVLADAVNHVPADFQPALSALMLDSLKLYPYQRMGHRVLRWWLEQPARGGLLADDMGLGKTLQVITVIAWLAEHRRLGPSLIVAPTSLLDNWERELKRFAPGARLKVVRLLSTPRGSEGGLRRFDIVLTSYESLAARDIEMGQIQWELLVCDEAQKIKNPTTRMTNAVKAMQANARIAMTGTPVENTLAELWCIVDFAVPGLLGSLSDFKVRYASAAVLSDEVAREAAANALRKRISPIFLRRMKHEVMGDQLPTLSRVRETVALSDLQRAIYVRLKARAQAGGRGTMIAALQHLLQVCAHPFSLYREGAEGLDPVSVCPKLEQTLQWLEEIRARGEKALVFVRWNSVQQILADVFQARFRLPAVHILNGAVPSGRRQAVVDAFQRRPGFDVMILAPRACGVGLNITAANHVIHYTREWNPAVESQATDRVYRIGQERPVTVYYPVVTHPTWESVEVVLDDLLLAKEALRDDFMQPISPVDQSAVVDRLVAQPVADEGADSSLGVSPVEILRAMVGDAGEEIEHPILGDELWAHHNGKRWWAVTRTTDTKALRARLDALLPEGQGTLALLKPLGRFTRRGPLTQRAALVEGNALERYIQSASGALGG